MFFFSIGFSFGHPTLQVNKVKFMGLKFDEINNELFKVSKFINNLPYTSRHAILSSKVYPQLCCVVVTILHANLTQVLINLCKTQHAQIKSDYGKRSTQKLSMLKAFTNEQQGYYRCLALGWIYSIVSQSVKFLFQEI